MTSLASIQSVDIPYTLLTQCKDSCIYTSGGRVPLPMPSRRVAGFVNGELFYGIATKECFSLQLFVFMLNFKVQV